ncbi:PP2C family protein-serine/threonine phosphatase [Shimia sp. FJ5]|uniref:PP2C family protein-serine/threonine phosphatase n=1 Tax=Shimia sp. FJ5 TaxID=3079054 RepID=UPI0026020BA5|nr:SpoIIE family protein phosphatase [Shimia sp. FJ5]MDV4144639.1 SpoIIE family protein phosphatase [Shimia sp. FJ5]
MQQVSQKTPDAEVEAKAIQRVLLVDDSRLQRRILSASLQREGYEVLEADTGEEALEICRQSPPDLVLSDWVMPKMDGLEFCRAFRSLSRDHYGYFILLTSKSEKAEVVRGLESGADDFLSKPVNAHELRARISAGERILKMQRELTQKNRVISETLDELRRLYDSLDNDLIEAKKLQQSLVRERFKDFGTGAASLMLHSSGHVGGDLVGHYRISDHKIGLYSIDVSGHGVSSALVTARLAGYLSSSSPEQNIALKALPGGGHTYLSPSEVIAHLNGIVFSDMETEHYFTMLLALIDLRSGVVEMAQAGHPHPVVLRHGGQLEEVGRGGLPVGLIEGAKFEDFETKLESGERLLILSDGVIECPDEDGQLLGEDGLAALLADLRDQPTESLLETLHWRLDALSGGKGLPDDVSGILFEYRGPWI